MLCAETAWAGGSCDFTKYAPLRGTFEGKVVREKATPKYPKTAIARGLAGTVSVEVLADRSGIPVQACAIRGPALLRPAAVEAASRFKFEPLLANGQAVPYVVHQVSFVFVLPKKSKEAQ